MLSTNSVMTGMDMMRYQGPQKPLMTSLAVIDANLNKFVKDIVESSVPDVNNFYIKTGIKNNCYTIMLFNAEKNMTVGSMIPLKDAIEKCSDKTIEMDLNARIRKMILRFDNYGFHGEEVNWID